MNTLRAARKGGMVAHLMSTESVSVCGRVMVFIPGGEGLRLCKTCARIQGVSVDIENTEFNFPEFQWTKEEREFIRTASDGFSLQMCSEVLTQYAENPKEYAAEWLYRHVAKMHAAYMLHTGREERAPMDPQEFKRSGNGNGGMIDPKNAKPAKGTGLTENQYNALFKMASWVDSMYAEIAELKSEENTHISRAEFITNERANFTRKEIDSLFSNLSKKIDELKSELSELKKAKRTQEFKNDPSPEGYFMMGETFVCVKSNRAKTGQYATVWDPETLSWEWDGRESRRLVADVKAGKLPRVSPEDAQRFGDLYGKCMRCGRTLTDANSIAEAMGKVCAGKMGW
jgi:hypothetical protein